MADIKRNEEDIREDDSQVNDLEKGQEEVKEEEQTEKERGPVGRFFMTIFYIGKWMFMQFFNGFKSGLLWTPIFDIALFKGTGYVSAFIRSMQQRMFKQVE